MVKLAELDAEMMRRYLLGDLRDNKMSQLEEQYFNEDESFELLQAIEDELIDDYVCGELPKRDRELFEKKYLGSSRLREKIEFSKSLHESGILAEQEPHTVRATIWSGILRYISDFLVQIPKPVIATAFLVLVVANIWSLIDSMDIRTRLDRFQIIEREFVQQEQDLQQQITQQHSQNEQLSDQLSKEREQRLQLESELSQRRIGPLPSIISFELMPGLLRGAPLKQIRLTEDTHIVKFRLRLLYEDGFTSYRADLQTLHKIDVWSQYNLKFQDTSLGKIVVLNLPASLLSNEDYVISISGYRSPDDFETLGKYYFTIIKE